MRMDISNRSFVLAKQATDYWMNVASIDLDHDTYMIQIYNLATILEIPSCGSDGLIDAIGEKDDFLNNIRSYEETWRQVVNAENE